MNRFLILPVVLALGSCGQTPASAESNNRWILKEYHMIPESYTVISIYRNSLTGACIAVNSSGGLLELSGPNCE